MFKRYAVISLPALTGLLIALFISGCAIKSGPRDFTGLTQPEARQDAGAGDRLAKAFTHTVQNGNRFMFSGWSVTKVQKRNSGFYYNGGYDREKGFNMDAHILGQPFRYYRWGNDVYISEEEKWRKAKPAETPMEPFADLEKIVYLTDQALRLPDEEVLGNQCFVYRITLKDAEAFEAAMFAGAMEVGTLQPAGRQFNQVTMQLTFWIGKKDNFIYQYKVETTMPVPGAGSLYQETYCRFWDYNSASINIQGPERLQNYLVEEKQAG